MNLRSVFEELDHLYEANDSEVEDVEAPVDEVIADDTATEDADEEIVIEDEPEAEEEVRLVLECTKCSGVSIKAEAEVTVDEEAGVANVDEACQYCEATEGYTIIGKLAQYDDASDEELEELLDVKLDARGFGGSGNNVSVLGGKLPGMDA